MTNDDLHREIKELRKIVDAQTDFIGILVSHGAILTAQAETILEMQRRALRNLGFDEKTVKDDRLTIFAEQLAVAQKNLAQSLSNAESSRPPSDSGPEVERN
jgi:hypothetical protein